MKTELLKLTGMTNEEGINSVRQALKKIAGISDIRMLSIDGQVSVQFDQERTSLQEIQTGLARAGHMLDVAQAKPSGCCGGCGGR